MASGGLLSGAAAVSGFTGAADITVTGTTGGSGTAGSAVNNAHKVINTVDKMLENVDKARSELGVVQNRLTSTVNNLNNTITNLSASRSRIEDADYAVEVSNMTRAQILQQAGTAVLAQANQVPQTMLSLLR
uniref:flagellin n=1 Tax=Castellaniella ginsengisoli TaxID=546114 RepID=UPI003F656CD5